MTIDLASLIARIEVATGPGRELDAEIHSVTLVGTGLPEGRTRAAVWINAPDCPAYTASLDAALALVPEGLCAEIDIGNRVPEPGDGWRASAEVYTHMYGDHWPAVHNVPALALCIAALRARAAL